VVNSIVLTSLQKDVLVGTLLGDACMERDKPTHNYRVRYDQTYPPLLAPSNLCSQPRTFARTLAPLLAASHLCSQPRKGKRRQEKAREGQRRPEGHKEYLLSLYEIFKDLTGTPPISFARSLATFARRLCNFFPPSARSLAAFACFFFRNEKETSAGHLEARGSLFEASSQPRTFARSLAKARGGQSHLGGQRGKSFVVQICIIKIINK
jgi:hypothetical protein